MTNTPNTQDVLRVALEKLEAIKELDENGLYREEIRFEGSGRYAVDIDTLDRLPIALKEAIDAVNAALSSAKDAGQAEVEPNYVIQQAAIAFAKAHVECDEMEARQGLDLMGNENVSDFEYRRKTDAYNATKAALIKAYRTLPSQQGAQPKKEEAIDLTIAYMSGFEDGKRSRAQPSSGSEPTKSFAQWWSECHLDECEPEFAAREAWNFLAKASPQPAKAVDAEMIRNDTLKEVIALCKKKYEAHAESGFAREASTARSLMNEITALSQSTHKQEGDGK